MSVGERTVSEINNSKLVCQRVSASLECPWARRMGTNNEKSRSSTTPGNMFPINTTIWISNLCFLQCVLARKWPMYLCKNKYFLSETWINDNSDANSYHWLALYAVFGQVCGVRLHNLNLFAFPCLILHRQQPHPGSGIAFSRMLS